jgi:hypothetical protein
MVPSAKPDRFTVRAPFPVTMAKTEPPPLVVKVMAVAASASSR